MKQIRTTALVMQIQQHKALLSPETKWMEGEKIWEFTLHTVTFIYLDTQ
jgi:hypothetical protein